MCASRAKTDDLNSIRQALYLLSTVTLQIRLREKSAVSCSASSSAASVRLGSGKLVPFRFTRRNLTHAVLVGEAFYLKPVQRREFCR